MKKIYTVIIAAAGLLAAACTDLSPEVYTDVRKEDYFKTPAQFSTLIANAYSQLAGEYGYIYRNPANPDEYFLLENRNAEIHSAWISTG